ncbi:MAG: hydantoinase/oxoprolinase N-terminal domain-containing protein, partial [Dehalococcoidia bacterium]
TRRPPLVPDELRFEVTERVAADGSVVTPLDEHEALEALRRIAEPRPDSQRQRRGRAGWDR